MGAKHGIEVKARTQFNICYLENVYNLQFKVTMNQIFGIKTNLLGGRAELLRTHKARTISRSNILNTDMV